MIKKINLAEGFAAFQETWSPRIAGDINNMEIKLTKFKGEFIWHHHDHEDELFLVIIGHLRMELRNPNSIIIGPGNSSLYPTE